MYLLDYLPWGLVALTLAYKVWWEMLELKDVASAYTLFNNLCCKTRICFTSIAILYFYILHRSNSVWKHLTCTVLHFVNLHQVSKISSLIWNGEHENSGTQHGRAWTTDEDTVFHQDVAADTHFALKQLSAGSFPTGRQRMPTEQQDEEEELQYLSRTDGIILKMLFEGEPLCQILLALSSHLHFLF